MHRLVIVLALALPLSVSLLATSSAAEGFKLAWSHYTGWEPWGYAADAGIVKRWADAQGIEIEVVLVNDYIESVNLYTAGAMDAVTVTNMDALSIPAVGGIDTTALIVGDFSDGNDGVVSSEAGSVAELKGKSVQLVELSVSHYLLARALGESGLRERDVTVVNTSDADIGGIFAANGGNVVTWNPILMSILGSGATSTSAKLLFDSSKIPGEIIDMLVVRTDADPRFKKALVGAWYETMKLMSGTDAAANAAIAAMAEQAGGTEKEFRAQLETTKMFFDPAEAVAFVKSPELKKTMKYVAKFSFDHGLYGAGAPSEDLVGIAFPDGSIQGDAGNVKLRFDASSMEMAAKGAL